MSTSFRPATVLLDHAVSSIPLSAPVVSTSPPVSYVRGLTASHPLADWDPLFSTGTIFPNTRYEGHECKGKSDIRKECTIGNESDFFFTKQTELLKSRVSVFKVSQIDVEKFGDHFPQFLRQRNIDFENQQIVNIET